MSSVNAVFSKTLQSRKCLRNFCSCKLRQDGLYWTVIFKNTRSHKWTNHTNNQFKLTKLSFKSFPVVSLDFLFTSESTLLLEDGDSLFQISRWRISVPLEFERHFSHLARQTKQSTGPRVQINHSRLARMQPEGNFAESLNANVLH